MTDLLVFVWSGHQACVCVCVCGPPESAGTGASEDTSFVLGNYGKLLRVTSFNPVKPE